MHISFCRSILAIAFLVSGICGDWEVLNDDSNVSIDEFDLQEELLLPVDVASRRSNSVKQQQSLSSKTQTEENNSSHETILKVQPEHHQNSRTASTAQRNTESKASAKVVTPQTPSRNHDSSSDKSKPAKTDEKSDDVIDLASEGLLSVESTNGKRSANNRKLAQFPESLQKDTSDKTVQKGSSKLKINSERRGEDSEKVISEKQSKISAEAESAAGDNEIDVDSFNFKVACIDENSWECLMFKEDFLAMKGDSNLSRRASVLERAKRQTNSHYKNIEIVKNSGNSRNLLGCEDGCFSGNGNDTDEEEVIPEFSFKSDTKIPTILTNEDLTDDKRQELIKQFQDQVTPIFKNIPGFKKVSVNPKYIHVDTDGNLVFDDWEVLIDGGDGNFTMKNGSYVGELILDALNQSGASTQLKNIMIDGGTPINDFDPVNAAKQVEQQASDPCAIKPSPCSYGYGYCERLPNTTYCLGIRLKCMDNCANFSDCNNNGACSKDIAGNAFCNCSDGWIGLYCGVENSTGANQDIITSPEYTVDMIAAYPTKLNDSDLTPAKREAIAKEIESKLNQVMKGLTGFKDISIDPNDIKIVNGKLIVPWNMTFLGSDPAFAGKTPEQIADIVRGDLQNVAGSYKKNVTLDGQEPIDDLDSVGAGEQIADQARDPCGQSSCPIGYGHCEALSATKVKCFHNCNARTEECMNGAACQLDSTGEGVCQCPEGMSGENCDVATNKLDGGQITGIVAGSALVAAGVIGSCCWFFLCGRLNQKDMQFSNYTDEESSGRSGSSNKPYVIDRPQIRVDGMSLFRNVPGPSSSSGSGGGSQPDPFRYSSA